MSIRIAGLAALGCLLFMPALTCRADGNVRATVQGGDLVVVGDGNDNAIIIRATTTSGRFHIDGVAGTTINGQDQLSRQNVTRDIRIDLKAGDNQVALTRTRRNGEHTEFECSRDLDINTQDGDDVVFLDDVNVGRNLTVRSRGGDDYLTLGTARALVNGRATVLCGSGEDHATLSNLDILKGLTYGGGGGSDFLHIHNSKLLRSTSIRGGSGADLLGAAFVRTPLSRPTFNGGGGENDGFYKTSSEFSRGLSVSKVENENVTLAEYREKRDSHPLETAATNFVDLVVRPNG